MTTQPDNALVGALEELVALVRGEFPWVLDEDSGGDARLSLRIDEALATHKAQQDAPAQRDLDADRIHEIMDESGGFWDPCSGCYESNEGYDVGPFYRTFRCHLGSGCRECGGIGARWDNTDYGAMADAMIADMHAEEDAPADPVKGGEGDSQKWQERAERLEGVLARLSKAARRVIDAREMFRSLDRGSHPNLVLEEAEAWIELRNCFGNDALASHTAKPSGEGEHGGYGRCGGTGQVWVDDKEQSNFYPHGACPDCAPAPAETVGIPAGWKKLAEAVAAHDYVMADFTVTGGTEAERRFSEGERSDTANEALHEALATLTASDIRALLNNASPVAPAPVVEREERLDADWFDEVEDLLDNYSDAEIIDGTTHPNKAMRLLCQLREAR